MQLEISYDPNERTFAIQSRFEQGAAWSLHVVGSMRGERTESRLRRFDLNGTRRELAIWSRWKWTRFYRYMSDLGLRYGEEFRPIRELAAGARCNRRAGWRFPRTIARRAGEYPLHPVLLDGALHMFLRRRRDG